MNNNIDERSDSFFEDPNDDDIFQPISYKQSLKEFNPYKESELSQ